MGERRVRTRKPVLDPETLAGRQANTEARRRSNAAERRPAPPNKRATDEQVKAHAVGELGMTDEQADRYLEGWKKIDGRQRAN